VLCAFIASAAFAAQKGNEAPQVKSKNLRALHFTFPDEHARTLGASSSVEKGHMPLGTVTTSAVNASPGQTVGWTYYDYQHNCSMGRMVDVGPHSGVTGAATVHFSWMHLPDSVLGIGRTYMYNAYISGDGSYAGAYRLHDYEDQYSGYVNVDVTPDNRALVGGHCDEKGPVPYMPHIHFDACSACKLFDAYVRLPDSLGDYEQEIGNEQTWPKFFFQFGSDTVLHIVSQCNTDNRTYHQTIMYFRKVGYEGTPTGWDYPPYCVDSVPIIAHDITGERLGDRVCMAWFANLPYQEPECDTCSGEGPYDFSLMENDMYLQISNDQGVNWEPRKNLTQAQIGEFAWKAWCDCSILFDQASNCHILFHTLPWPADPCIAEGEESCMEGDVWQAKSRLMHWSENIPYVRTVADHSYQPSDTCGVPSWASTVAKMGLAECDGKLYAMWTQFNDIPNGIDNDCAEWVYTENLFWGGLNGDIWISVSEDGGMTWDAQRNLTNSYTPHCDPWGGSDCQNDYWATINRWGKQAQTGEDWSGADIIDPSGGTSPTDWYLDIQYINDLDAGGAIWGDEGSWVNDPVKWFRVACVEPVPNPLFACSWRNYGDPNYNKPGTEKLVDLDFENLGNVALEYSIAITEDNGPTGWLNHQNFSGTVPSGLNNIETGQVILNVGGMIATSGNYFGRLTVSGNDPVNLPLDIEIELIVADTVCPVDFDLINTNLITLSVANYGNMGNDGQETVNMDFYPEDCDSFATVYLYDGSPFVGRGTGAEATFDNGIWQTSYLDDYGFRPQCGHTPNEEPCSGLDNAEVYESGTFSTQDSAVALEMIWVAPAEDVSFILEYMKVWSFDGGAHADLMLGEVIDWDIPWDYKDDDVDLEVTAVNYGLTDGPRNLLYCQGYEAYGANVDTGYPYNCQYNDERFGGHAMIESYLNGAPRMAGPYGGFCGENDSLVYPANEGFLFEPFYLQAAVSGLRASDSLEDLHTAMVYENALDLGATDVYEVVSFKVTVHQGDLADLQAAADAAEAWYTAHGGIAMFQDLDESGQIDICETCCKIMGDFQYDDDLDPLDAVSFVNWMWRGGAGPECPDACDVNCSGGDPNPMDAVYLVNYFWRGGPPPCDCSELP